MAVKDTPIFTQSTKTAFAICTAAKTTYNDATGAVLLVTAGADGALVKSLKAVPRATVTATQLQVYLSKDAGTTLILLPYSALLSAYTMAATTAVPATDCGVTNLRLEANDRLYVAAGVALAAGIVFTAEYENF